MDALTKIRVEFDEKADMGKFFEYLTGKDVPFEYDINFKEKVLTLEKRTELPRDKTEITKTLWKDVHYVIADETSEFEPLVKNIIAEVINLDDAPRIEVKIKG